MILTIKITKEVLKRSMNCSGEEWKNCAISVAIRDLMPDADVFNDCIEIDGLPRMYLPKEAEDFTRRFDKLVLTPRKRLDLPEFSFQITLPDSVIEAIEIGDVEKSETLEIVNN